MTDHVARLYALALALVVFFVTWATVAARPWAAETDPRVVALAKREQRLAREQVRVQRLVARRFAAYRRQLAQRQRAAAAAPVGAAPAPAAAAAPPAPPVQVVSAPPVTATRSS